MALTNQMANMEGSVAGVCRLCLLVLRSGGKRNQVFTFVCVFVCVVFDMLPTMYHALCACVYGSRRDVVVPCNFTVLPLKVAAPRRPLMWRTRVDTWME